MAEANGPLREFRLPDVGEGLTEADVLTWHVAVGDAVVVNQVLVEIETAKAVVELPAPYAGVVHQLLVGEGETVPVGTPLLTVATDEPAAPGGGAGTPAAAGGPAATDATPSAPGGAEVVPTSGGAAGASGPAATGPAVTEAGEPASGSGRTAVLVGYGVKETGAPRRRPRVPAATPSGAPAPEPGPEGEAGRPTRIGGVEFGREIEQRLAAARPVLAKPPVRQLARELGVDLAAVEPTGPDGVVTRADVERAAMLADEQAARALVAPAAVGAPASGAPDDADGADDAGEAADGAAAAAAAARARRPAGPAARREERFPVRGVLRAMADAMVASAFSAPHVTEWVDVDVTPTMELLARLKAYPGLSGVRVTPLSLVAVALLRAVRRNPGINATFDDAAGELVIKRYVNLGIAVATPRGLVVPNVKDAHTLTLPELAVAMNRLVEAARAGRSTPADMSAGTITITNVGVFGVDGGTPIINPGEAAILAVGRVLPRPWVVDGAVVPRQVATLSLSFDHRCVDGAMGSAVLAEVAGFLSDPTLALALG